MSSNMDRIAIRTTGLGKKYLVGQKTKIEGDQTFRDALALAARRLVRSAGDMVRGRPLIVGDEVEEFWALKGIDIEIEQGDVVGMIGRNGAGKSTLLKVLSRITPPSAGRVEIRGRIASLLEVGTGFHPELSGRENIFLNGAVLGMSRSEIRRKFDEIVDFAGVEKFLDTPVKRYSSGMYVRLAFAVAAHLEPEILVVDEVLAVGDAEFQDKCLGKMQQVGNSGRTVVFVSHNLSAVRRMCERVYVIDAGEIAFSGSVESGIDFYERMLRSSSVLGEIPSTGGLTEYIVFEQIRYRQNQEWVDGIDASLPFEVEITGLALRFLRQLDLHIDFFRDGFHVFSCYDTDAPTDMNKGRFKVSFFLPEHTLSAGAFVIGLGASEAGGLWCWGTDVGRLDVSWANFRTLAGRVYGPINVASHAIRIQDQTQ